MILCANIIHMRERKCRNVLLFVHYSSNRTSCRSLFKKMGILPLQSQYILSLALFVVKNMEMFTPNSHSHKKYQK